MTKPRDAASKVSPERRITYERLAENFALDAVADILIRQTAPSIYQIEVSAAWKPDALLLLTATRDTPRVFKSLDYGAKVLLKAARGKPVKFRVELLP